MPSDKKPRIALVWAHFSVSQVDRCIALARHLDGRAEVLGVEVATITRDYAAFPPSGAIGGALKRTLFPGRLFEEIPRWRRFMATLGALRGSSVVCIGVPYNELEFVLLAWVLRLLGKQVVLMCDSKFDDRSRNCGFEMLKALGLAGFNAVMVASSRGSDYFRFLGFRRRPVLLGCDTVGIDRIRSEAASAGQQAVAFAQRDFVFIGRLVAKKNLALLIAAYGRYCELAGGRARRLVLVGSGPLEQQLREAAAKIPGERIVFTGFLVGPQLYGVLSVALGLVLVSYSEEWGLVVNEALALGLPVIASEAPGARDVLVRRQVNGFVLENGSVEGIARAMQQLGSDEAAWHRMSAASRERAPLGDVAMFCASLAGLFEPSDGALQGMQR